MKMFKISSISGSLNHLDLPLTEQQLKEGMLAWQGGMYIQDAFPSLGEDEREFIMSGITPQEWLKVFGDE